MKKLLQLTSHIPLRKLMMTVTATAYCLLATAQAPDIEWENTIGGNDIDVFTSIHQNSDHGYIIAGYSRSGDSGDKSEALIGSEWNDYWIVRLDEAGEIMWENTLGGNSEDLCYDVRETPDGGFIAIGGSLSNVGFDKWKPDHNGDMWIIKLKPTGVIDWQKTYGGSGGDDAISMDLTSDGGYIIGGSSGSNTSGNKSEMCRGKADYWIVKLNASGDIEWDKTFGGSEHDWLYMVRQATDGGYIVTGYSNSPVSGDKTSPIEGPGDNNWDCWAIKTDAFGNIEWQNTIGGSFNDLPYGLDVTSDGGYIIGMESASPVSGDKTEGSVGGAGFADYWIVKLDENGNITWQNVIGGFGGDFIGGIVQLADGGYMVGGSSSSNVSGDKTIPAIESTSDYWLLKLDESGSVIWQKVIGGTGGDGMYFGQCLEQTSDGGFILGGNSTSGISADKSEICQGGTSYGDYWIVKLSPEQCSPADGLTVNLITHNSAKLHWNHVPDVEWQVWFRPLGELSWSKKNAYDNSKIIKPLIPGTTYEYKIKTQCEEDVFSAFSTTETFTTLPLRLGHEDAAAILYPNPASDKVVISLNNRFDEVILLVMDISGKTIESHTTSGDEFVLDVINYPAGIYFVHTIADGLRLTEKLIIE